MCWSEILLFPEVLSSFQTVNYVHWFDELIIINSSPALAEDITTPTPPSPAVHQRFRLLSFDDPGEVPVTSPPPPDKTISRAVVCILTYLINQSREMFLHRSGPSQSPNDSSSACPNNTGDVISDSGTLCWFLLWSWDKWIYMLTIKYSLPPPSLAGRISSDCRRSIGCSEPAKKFSSVLFLDLYASYYRSLRLTVTFRMT